ARAEEDFLRHAVAELDTLAPEHGEEAALDTRRRLLQAAERMRLDVSRALAGLGPDGAEGAMAEALRWLNGLASEAEGTLDPALAALDRAMVELGEAQSGVERFAEMLDADPRALERLEDRLFEIRAQARKHGVQPDDLTDLAGDLRARLDALNAGGGRIADLSAAAQAADADYRDAAAALSQARRVAAERLDAAMAHELAPLKLERATFTTRIEPGEAGPDGTDRVSFEVATNPGAPPGPINRIASGGELSRFLLALKVCLTSSSPEVTMIFDEIDRGIGGATADAVGRRLQSLSESGQVLVVTHSPQVAARGGHHWRVAKDQSDGHTLSRVTPLSAGDRVDEVARMLAGDRVTDAARAAARELLTGG
ncbi:MAG: DNA repair protein RecN, partial [Pseudomonadota bacterium]